MKCVFGCSQLWHWLWGSCCFQATMFGTVDSLKLNLTQWILQVPRTVLPCFPIIISCFHCSIEDRTEEEQVGFEDFHFLLLPLLRKRWIFEITAGQNHSRREWMRKQYCCDCSLEKTLAVKCILVKCYTGMLGWVLSFHRSSLPGRPRGLWDPQ